VCIRAQLFPLSSAILLRSQVDIGTLDADAIEPLNANLWLLSPACQPYTVLNPRAKGAADPRAQSFLHLIENVLPALVGRGTAPARLLVENVAGFEVRDHYHAVQLSLAQG
jgi:tRNA (cytosine38-C5)-methyltransferase